MFRWYGLLGVILIGLVEANFIFKVQPFANWYFPIVWIGYILIVDAAVYALRNDSLLSNRARQLAGMALISGLFWWVFEFTNLIVRNWNYSGIEELSTLKTLFGFLSFATVLPALFETVELFTCLHGIRKAHLQHPHPITRRLLHWMTFAGVLAFLLPLMLPKLAFPLVWLSFFLLLDPFNYAHRQPSIISHLRDRKLTIPLALAFGGLAVGFLWEFWNYWAIPKWTYTIPYVGFWKIFEMPILGYLGYPAFAFELYAMYWFVRSLFMHKEKVLADGK